MTRRTDSAARAGCCVPSPDSAGPSDAVWPKTTPNPPNLSLVSLTGGSFLMGADDGPHPEDGEGPAREVTLDPFSIAPLTVTNAQFAQFVKETRYVTRAEQDGFSFVFQGLVPVPGTADERVRQAPWWIKIGGASWQWPEGPQGDRAEARADHPVVHIARPDALAYCAWAGVRLPTEAEWEFAARGGLAGQPYPWGDKLEDGGAHHCNIWQGRFPDHNSGGDGYIGTAPAACYAPNGYGLHAMTGNVWEWTADRFTTLHSPRPSRNPKGPLNGGRYVVKGGSYLCHASYCHRYRTSSRQALDPMSTAGNLGFRVASDPC